MRFRDLPIRSKLMALLLSTSGAVLILTCVAFVSYEFLSFRTAAVRNLSTLARVVANNSTAVLAFDNQDEAAEVLAALKGEPHIVTAGLYDAEGHLFAQYPAKSAAARAGVSNPLPPLPGADGNRFVSSGLISVVPVREGTNRRLGTLYVRSDLLALREQLVLYSVIAVAMTGIAFLVAYLISRLTQPQISRPIQVLAQAARLVSQRRDYSVRATKLGDDEMGSLTEAFNQMLAQIQEQDSIVRTSEARLLAYVSATSDAVYRMSPDWDELRQLEGKGFLADTAQPSRDWLDKYICPEDQEGLMQVVRQAIRSKAIFALEHRVRRADGAVGWIFSRAVPLRGADGEIVEWFGAASDVTHRKEAQFRLQAQFARLDLLNRITRAVSTRQDLRSIFQVVIRRLEDNLPIEFGCICLYDAAKQTLTVTNVGSKSRKLALQLALTEQAEIPIDANGMRRCVQGELVYEADTSESSFPFPLLLARNGLHALVMAPLLAESKVFGALIAARRQSGGFDSGDCEFVRQLSEHVGLAAHQAQLYTELHAAYQDLRESQQTILQQERLRALGQMASGVAHDINNAISPVALYTESLLESEPGLSKRARTFLTTIQQAIHDVAQTVSRMRDFYRKREPEAVPSPIDLNQTVPGVIELTRARWRDVPQQRGIVIDVRAELTKPLPLILGAEHEIRDALTNLILNAVDAMPGGGALTIRTRAVSPQDPRDSHDSSRPPTDRGEIRTASVCLEVSDTGMGMDEETRRRCLEPFFTTKGERGTGLGLAMVYGMVERHGGDLDIDSTPGHGTTVRMVFPISPELADPTALQPVLAESSRPLRILIIDDDPLIIESLREVLRAEGHQVTAADGGQAGIDAFVTAQTQAESFSAVITDLGMPYVDGRRVAAAVKAASTTTPVILLTGWGQRLSAENDLPEGVDRVLAKPPKLRELRLALAELTRGNSIH